MQATFKKTQRRNFGADNFLSSLSDADLIFETKEAIKTEREATAVVVRYFKEISERELYLKHACSSLFQFATEKLGYCAASAQARINAMRLISAVPEVEAKIESGELTLTAASKMQTFFQAERKENKVYSVEQKLEVINVCLSKSTREIERELAQRNPEVAKVEFVKPVGRDRFQVSFSISEETEDKMKRLKGLFAHTNPNMSTEELFNKLIDLGLEKFDPIRKAKRSESRRSAKNESQSSSSAKSVQGLGVEPKFNIEIEVARHDDDEIEQSVEEVFVQRVETGIEANVAHKLESSFGMSSFRAHEMRTQMQMQMQTQMQTQMQMQMQTQMQTQTRKQTQTRSRYISAAVKHKIWLRNAGRGCEHKSEGGERCGETRALQIDHIHGFARGGLHTLENLRVLCARHNRAEWSQSR